MVLVIDDEADIQGLLLDVLSSEGIEAEAAGPLDALEALDRLCPNVVLLDISMPRKDGLETCRALRASVAGRDVPIIMVTASHRPEDAIGAFEVGANDYLAKPFSLSQLRAKAQTWLLRTARPGV